MNADGRESFRISLESIVKITFNLKGSDLFSYKKQVDKNRNDIIKEMKRIYSNECDSVSEKSLDTECESS